MSVVKEFLDRTMKCDSFTNNSYNSALNSCIKFLSNYPNSRSISNYLSSSTHHFLNTYLRLMRRSELKEDKCKKETVCSSIKLSINI